MEKELPWYHGAISTDETIRICTRVGKNGAFLLRDSQREPDAFTMSVFYKNETDAGEVYHYRIRKTDDDKLFIKVIKKYFTSWEELTKFCKTPRESEIFPQPLVRAIQKSEVEEWRKSDPKWRESIKEEKEAAKAKNESPSTKPKATNTSAHNRFVDFFRKPNKLFSNFNKEKMEPGSVHESDDGWDDEWDDNEDGEFVPYQAIQVNCQKKLIAKADSTGQENEMDFKKGDEMILEGVRTDGWWYCLNQTQNTHGWVHESSLQRH